MGSSTTTVKTETPINTLTGTFDLPNLSPDINDLIPSNPNNNNITPINHQPTISSNNNTNLVIPTGPSPNIQPIIDNELNDQTNDEIPRLFMIIDPTDTEPPYSTEIDINPQDSQPINERIRHNSKYFNIDDEISDDDDESDLDAPATVFMFTHPMFSQMPEIDPNATVQQGILIQNRVTTLQHNINLRLKEHTKLSKKLQFYGEKDKATYFLVLTTEHFQRYKTPENEIIYVYGNYLLKKKAAQWHQTISSYIDAEYKNDNNIRHYINYIRYFIRDFIPVNILTTMKTNAPSICIGDPEHYKNKIFSNFSDIITFTKICKSVKAINIIYPKPIVLTDIIPYLTKWYNKPSVQGKITYTSKLPDATISSVLQMVIDLKNHYLRTYYSTQTDIEKIVTSNDLAMLQASLGALFEYNSQNRIHANRQPARFSLYLNKSIARKYNKIQNIYINRSYNNNNTKYTNNKYPNPKYTNDKYSNNNKYHNNKHHNNKYHNNKSNNKKHTNNKYPNTL